jgi:hypothetical protein
MDKAARGSPTKDFFVAMLTRDIELTDAILDLLDNCLDGVVRQRKTIDKRSCPNYYDGYYADITISTDFFVIEDNCGGIPQDIAEKYAFRMGRSAEKSEDSLPTVGIYGIGMKRAIFKIGKSAEVLTRNNGMLYRVTIPTSWASDEEKWDFPIEDIEDKTILEAGGTRIVISDINSGISASWNTDDKLSSFVDRLIKSIQQSYSFIIQKGFTIKINGSEISPLSIELLMSDNHDEAIKPFLYKAIFKDVRVSLAVGFYAPPPSPEDIDDENELRRSSSDAGWTIVCNDRVVLYNDKSHLTGWGEAGVPQYHTQFIGIRGIVIFESNNPKNLPMTTTKRGIDTSSNIYAAVKNKMRQGLKLFTDYTNRWKGRNDAERAYSNAATRISVERLIGSQNDIEAAAPIKFRKNKEGLIFEPQLPKPHNDKPYRVIRFSKSVEDIQDIIEYLYNDKTHDISNSKLGEKCFDLILGKARAKESE